MLALLVVFHRFLISPRTLLVVVKHNAMKTPFKQDFMIKNKLLDETNDIYKRLKKSLHCVWLRADQLIVCLIFFLLFC